MTPVEKKQSDEKVKKDLKVSKETLKDLDIPEDAAEAVKGGAFRCTTEQTGCGGV